jgi:transposase
MEDWVQPASRGELPRREVMQTPDEVGAMLRLKAVGWGVRRIAGELGCSHMTVRRYLSAGGWVAYRVRGRPRTLSGLEEWVAERFRRHAGNADVVRQELEREKGIRLTLRTVEREVRHLRRELEAEAGATIRFETPPGKQLQIDFGERRAMIGDENVKVYLLWRRWAIRGGSMSGHSVTSARRVGLPVSRCLPSLRRGYGGGAARQ